VAIVGQHWRAPSVNSLFLGWYVWPQTDHLGESSRDCSPRIPGKRSLGESRDTTIRDTELPLALAPAPTTSTPRAAAINRRPAIFYGPVVGYLAPPTPISGGDDGIDACSVGENADGVIVAFRGTLPASWQSQARVLDWLQNLLADPHQPTRRAAKPGTDPPWKRTFLPAPLQSRQVPASRPNDARYDNGN
jgi:hypothetical protein